MRKSIFFKIFSGFFFITLLLSAAILVFSFNIINKYSVRLLANDLKNTAVVLREETLTLIRSGRTGELDAFVKRLEKQIHTRVTVIRHDGTVLADSEEDPAGMENHGNRPEALEALKGVTGTAMRSSATTGEQMLYVAVPVYSGDRIIGVIRTSMFLRDINSFQQTIRSAVVQIAAGCLILSLILSFVFTKRLAKPIQKLSAATRSLASGDFNTKVAIEDTAELKELADSFNDMTAKVKELFSEVSHKKEELNSIITSITEGLFVLDAGDRIVAANTAFKRIAGTDEPEGKHLWEVARDPKLMELLAATRNDKKNISREIELKGKTYLCSTSLLAAGSEITIVLHDISEMKNVERIKKDFIANVSHELRTPLTAIKGFVETMESSCSEENKRYLEIVKRHTERLSNITEDLLVLSELDGKEAQLKTESIDLEGLLRENTSIFLQKLKEKGIELRVDVESGLPPLNADPFKLSQVIINLVDNAVKYTEKGRIEISARKKGGAIAISVSDTGIGIPEEYIPRVFERFFVVDKSRSRKLGGTGLGLAIVKHIVLLHNGVIAVESTPGKGTTFTVTLPF